MNIKILFIQETLSITDTKIISGTVEVNGKTTDFDTNEETGLLQAISGININAIEFTNSVYQKIETTGYKPRMTSASDLLGAELF